LNLSLFGTSWLPSTALGYRDFILNTSGTGKSCSSATTKPAFVKLGFAAC